MRTCEIASCVSLGWSGEGGLHNRTRMNSGSVRWPRVNGHRVCELIDGQIPELTTPQPHSAPPTHITTCTRNASNSPLVRDANVSDLLPRPCYVLRRVTVGARML